MRALIFSSNVAIGEEEKGPESAPIMGTMLVTLSIVIAIFFVGPLLLTGWLEEQVGSHFWVVVLEGLVRLAIVVGYVGFIGLMPDVRRVYQYHGAEHKSIHALEHGDPLDAEHVQRYPTAHVRCGTSFLLTVVVVSILVFAAVGSQDLWLRILSRIVLIPVIASISYEVIRLGGAFESNPITKVLMWPNLALQSLTTRQPDDGQVEVALRALNEVLAADASVATVETTDADESAAETPPLN
jgi:uncharacterized protein YqhQ